MCQVNTNPMISQVGYLQVVGEFAVSYAELVVECSKRLTREITSQTCGRWRRVVEGVE